MRSEEIDGPLYKLACEEIERSRDDRVSWRYRDW